MSGVDGDDTFFARDGLRDTVAGGWEGNDRAQIDDDEAEVTGIEELLQ
jgi:hypothetical protein